MDFNDYTPLVNTIILIIIFFYQKNRNKLLLDRIQQQEKVINETKGIVTQQSTAIDSQSRVVDTAIRYSESFSPEKLTEIIRREVEVEHKEEKSKVEEKYKQLLESKAGREPKHDREYLKRALGTAHDYYANVYINPYLVSLILLFHNHLSSEERQEFVDNFEDGDAKEMMIGAIEKVEEVYPYEPNES